MQILSDCNACMNKINYSSQKPGLFFFGYNEVSNVQLPGLTEILIHIHSKSQDEMIQMTADLIQTCFELRNTGIREAACQYRIKELAETMSILFKTLKKYKDNPEAQRYKRSLNEMLNRSSQFAAFKRNYVKKHLGDYPGLENMVT